MSFSVRARVNMRAKEQEERSLILSWLVDGFGITKPPSIFASTVTHAVGIR